MRGGGGVRRAVVEDVRGGAFLRLTWHGEGDLFVLSQWRGDVCVAASRFGVGGAAELVGVLVEGMTDVATRQAAASAPEDPPSRGLSTRLRRRLAQLLAPPLPSPPPPDTTTAPAVPVGPGERWMESTMLRWKADGVS